MTEAASLLTNALKVHAARLLMDAEIEATFIDIVPTIDGDLLLKVQTASKLAWATMRADMNFSLAQCAEYCLRPAVHKVLDELQALN